MSVIAWIAAKAAQVAGTQAAATIASAPLGTGMGTGVAPGRSEFVALGVFVLIALVAIGIIYGVRHTSSKRLRSITGRTSGNPSERD